MNDPRNLAVEIRRLRETIELLSDLIDRGEKVANKIERETKAFEIVRSNRLDTFDYFKFDSKNLRSVIKAVATQWNVTPNQIISQRRTQHLIYPRFAFCHIAHKVMSYTSHEVGLALDNRNHTTILHACDRTEDLLQNDKQFADNYNAVCTAIKARSTPTSQERH